MLLIGFEPASRFQSGARGASSFVWSSSLATEPVSACSGTQQSRVLSSGSEGTAADRRRLPSERAVVRRTAAMRSAPLPCRLYALVAAAQCSHVCSARRLAVKRVRSSLVHAHIARTARHNRP